jgi:hypothetical protein
MRRNPLVAIDIDKISMTEQADWEACRSTLR